MASPAGSAAAPSALALSDARKRPWGDAKANAGRFVTAESGMLASFGVGSSASARGPVRDANRATVCATEAACLFIASFLLTMMLSRHLSTLDHRFHLLASSHARVCANHTSGDTRPAWPSGPLSQAFKFLGEGGSYLVVPLDRPRYLHPGRVFRGSP